jgi:hypothetical protein
MPECDFSFPRRWMMGRTNARVLPVPVWAVFKQIALQQSREREFSETFHLDFGG